MYKVILSDVDNTLLDFEKCAELSVKEACKELNITYGERLMQTFTPVNDFLWGQVEKGLLTVERLHEIRWATIFEKLSLPYDGISFERVFRKYLKEAAVPVDGAKEILSYLKPKYYLAVASNSSFNQQYGRLEKAGMTEFFDAFFMSEKVGYNKPDPRFFESVLKELPVKDKKEVLFIGDSLSADVKGGVDFGIDVCWFNRYGAETPNLPIKYQITKLSQIKNIL